MRNRRGSILLLSLLIMGAVAATMFTLSAVTLSSLAQSRVIDGGIVAAYAAESGVEEAVYQARKVDILPTCVGASCPVPAQTFASNQAGWTRTIETAEPVLYVRRLLEGATYEISLYDPNDETRQVNIDQITVSWSGGSCSRLEVTQVEWTPGSALVLDPSAIKVSTYPCGSGSAMISVNPTRAYRMRFKPVQGDMREMQIQAWYAGATHPPDVPGRVKIVSTGTYGSIRRAVTASIPQKTPLAGIFDYVVFSECSLIKGGTANCP